MFTVDRPTFDLWVEEAWLQIPNYFRNRVKNLSIEVEETSPAKHSSLLGLYIGVPLPLRSSFSEENPDRILLYKQNLERTSHSEEELKEQIRLTLWHELGHYFGMEERDLRHRGY